MAKAENMRLCTLHYLCFAVFLLMNSGDAQQAVKVRTECGWEHAECVRPRSEFGVQYRLAIRQVAHVCLLCVCIVTVCVCVLWCV
jgi:hypothetical protein